VTLRLKAGRLHRFGFTLQATRLCLVVLEQFRRSRRASFDVGLDLQSASNRLVVVVAATKRLVSTV